MMRTPRLVFACALAPAVVAALTGLAAAQPSETQPAPVQPVPAVPPVASQPPPAGGDGSDLSHINGTPVKVGEHNEYYYKLRRTNLSANPLGWIFGFYGFSASFALGNHVALHGDVTYYSIIDSDTSGLEFSVGVPIYLRRTWQGPFLEPGFMTRRLKEEYYDAYGDHYDDDYDTEAGPQVLVGWHWLWDSGLNLAMAVGGGRNVAPDDDDEYDDDDEPFFNGYLRFGYAF